MIGLSNSLKSLIFKLLIIFLISMTLYSLISFFSFYSFFSLLKAIFIIIVFILYGYNILFFFLPNNAKPFSLLTTMGIGLIFTSFFFLLLSSLFLVNTVSISFFYSLPLAISFFTLYKNKNLKKFLSIFKSFTQKSSIWEFFIVLIPLIYAMLPSTFYDVLVYHLGIPNSIIQYGGFAKLPFTVYFNTSIFYEISLIPVTYAGDLVPRLFHYILSTVFIISVINFSQKIFNIKQRILLLSLIIFMPLSMFLITTIKNDLISTVFIFLGIKLFYDNAKNLSAIFWGFSLGIKYFNIIPFIIFVVFIFIKYDRFKIKELLKFLTVSFLMIVPLLLKNLFLIGNPVYPFFYNIFKTNSWDLSRSLNMKSDVGNIIKSFSDFIKLPYNLSLKTYGYIGNIGIQFLLFLPFLILNKVKKSKLFYFSIFTLFIGSCFTYSIRFFYIVFIIFSIFTVFIIEKFNNKLLLFVLIILIFINLGRAFVFQETLYQSNKFYAGKFDNIEYKKKFLPEYTGYELLNKKTDKNSKILLIGESRNFYLKRKYTLSSALDYSILKKYIKKEYDFNKFKENLIKDNINYVFISKNEFMRNMKKYKRINKEILNKALKYLNRFPMIFNKNSISIYKINNNSITFNEGN